MSSKPVTPVLMRKESGVSCGWPEGAGAVWSFMRAVISRSCKLGPKLYDAETLPLEVKNRRPDCPKFAEGRKILMHVWPKKLACGQGKGRKANWRIV
jgi:hypothetical protein